MKEDIIPIKDEIVLYQSEDGNVKVDVLFQDETVWLTQEQMAMLFGKGRTTITEHIANIFSEGELNEEVVCRKFRHTTQHGAIEGLLQTQEVKYYNLDVIISVGYRVKSQRGTQFRQWANKVLKEYLLRGYSVNQRFERLEQRVAKTEEQIDFFVKTSLPPVQGIFFDGQIFDAYHFVADLIRKAKTSVTLIDNYVDDTVFTLLDKRDDGVTATIYTQHVSRQLQLDIDKHNAQYAPITIKGFNKAHDRFLLIDHEVYHIGASLKDLGKKWFAFTQMKDLTSNELINRIE